MKMKKYLIAAAITLSLVIPSALSAQEVLGTSTTTPVSSCLTLNSKLLRYGAKDSSTNREVTALQNFLKTKGYLNAAPTGYFGPLTLAGVKKYQLANEIQSTGFAGPITRAHIKALSCKTAVTIPGCSSGAIYNAITGVRCNLIGGANYGTGSGYLLPGGITGGPGSTGGPGGIGALPTGAAKRIAILSPIAGDKFNSAAVVPVYFGLINVSGPQVITASLYQQAGSGDTFINTITATQDIKSGINRIDFTPGKGSSYTAAQLTGKFRIKLEVGTDSNAADSTAYFELGNTLYKPGDMNGDGQITIADYIDLATMYGTRVGFAGYKSAGDLNGDGVIDATDFKNFNTLMQLANYGLVRSGDIDGSGTVSIADFITLASIYGKKVGDAGYNEKADLDYSGAIDANDFKIMDILFRAANE